MKKLTNSDKARIAAYEAELQKNAADWEVEEKKEVSVAEKIYESLKFYADYKGVEGEFVSVCTNSLSASDFGLSSHQFAGHLSALEAKGLYVKNGEGFGRVKF